MTPTDFSVLLLAWDDADPGVAVLGGSALPPTLPLVYQLAAHHPVLAVYPHLPAPETTAALEAAASASASEEAAAPTAAPAAADSVVIANPLDVTTDAPGVHLLAPAEVPHNFFAVPSAIGSRLVGLEDLQPAIQGPLPTSHSLSLAPGVAPGAGISAASAQPAAAARSQWPANAGPHTERAAAWQAPAAPYAGAAAAGATGALDSSAVTAQGTARVRESFPPPPPAPPRAEASSSVTVETSAADDASAARATRAAPDTSGSATAATNPAPAISVPDSGKIVPAHFDEPVEEMGAAEARDLNAPEDDLVPDAAPLAAATAASAASETGATTPEPSTTWAVRQPALDGLNFRMIQYARRAAQLVDGRPDFDVIYAPGWPAWLAALEIRNRSGRPLVLYVPALASDTAPAAERGWLLGLERMVLRRATLVLVPDAHVLRQLRTHHDDALGETRIVPAADEAAVQQVLAEVALG
ncbi:glycosyltransferase [Hymenobacter sp. DH14]|uniref:Glycosyltransferase n=1 Tax=Hymenobacter cyanobacteriorum TaxID=2926463 RepID=A0A9X2AEB0_9BACT|nr:glycosyltransferase [Hymenobacter cyanobacteriorum]MCI1187011.1 glycosyltransferase [Hymenobacter cyanobacteriorum]